MSKGRGLQDLLDQAKEQEKTYDWAKAAEVYGRALGLVAEEDFLRRGELQEQIGYCKFRGAYQAEIQEQFKTCMLETAEAYERAAEAYEKVEPASSWVSNARSLYARASILIDASQRKAVLDDCAKMGKKAVKAFNGVGDRLEYGKACNDLLLVLYELAGLAWDWSDRKKYLEAAITVGQNAISTLSEVGDKAELIRSYSLTGEGCASACIVLGEGAKVEFKEKTLDYVERALALSKETDDDYLIALSRQLAGHAKAVLTDDLKGALTHFGEMLHHAEKTKDNALIGLAHGWIAAVFKTMALTEEEGPERKRQRLASVIHQEEDAVRRYLIVHRYDWLPVDYALYSEGYMFLALEVATDVKERRALLDEGIRVGLEGLEHSERSSVPQVYSVHHVLSKVFYTIAKMETQTAEKRRLLEAALNHREKHLAITEQHMMPSEYWERGVGHNYLALIEAEIAAIETNDESKRRLLESAISRMERCVDLCAKWVTLHPRVYLSTFLGLYYVWFGGILNQLYSLTGEKEALERAVEVYQRSAEVYRKADLLSRVAEANWHTARLHDQLGEHINAEHSFQSASENYRLAAERIPQLKEFYMDHARYMQAWSEIEKAKQRHADKQYGSAKEHYEKAANLHKSTERWNYLSPNYLALALVEEAEDLSRKEQAEEAKALFEQAVKRFAETKDSIETRLGTIDVQDEKEVATQLVKASDARRDYCLGRVTLEDAKILDRQGDHGASSRSYSVAAEQFREVAEAMELEADRRELSPLVDLCRAWHAMTRAEAEASPNLYLEASELFEEAKKHSVDEKAKVLALGHSSFCKALEAGTRFEATGDEAMYSTAKKHLEAATKYYLKAGFKNASEYARATHRLFDASLSMHNAETETDPRKKAQFYQMTEKLLQASAGSFMKAKHPEKGEEVQRLLESAKEERQLATSLAEVLHVPTITSTTTSFSSPTPTREQAVGLERFEHADVQANLILRVKEVRVGEDISLAIEVVNAGKAPALLIKVDEVIPEGFEIREVPEMYTFEDSYINLKGKRLNPLKTEDVKIVVNPRSKGTHIIKPRILYIDEAGKYKSHEPEPVTIIVKELGIGGWIKGER